ncbi:transposable element Tc3 transposase [Trichonephila clavipes]|nr:transposable element Tc3 transposase [Trichonephila clavipes]
MPPLLAHLQHWIHSSVGGLQYSSSQVGHLITPSFEVDATGLLDLDFIDLSLQELSLSFFTYFLASRASLHCFLKVSCSSSYFFLCSNISLMGVLELWFQQDVATCHTARATIDLLKDTFGDRLISRFRPVNWPTRSCDLTPLDYFLWGYVKSLVYADKPQTLDHLKDNIRRVIADIRPQMLEKVIENWTSRLDYIRARSGSHMSEIIFKM